MSSPLVTGRYGAAVQVADGAQPGRVLGTVYRLRLIAVCLALTLLAFSQSSGSEAADTKLDLVVAPARFLRGALTLWDPTAAAGQLQDQAYGYLFPMGPFFLIGKLMALPAWVIQRGWESALLITAFLGVMRLARLLGVRGFWPRVGAGLLYALAPRMLMELGVISSELMPVAALPWVLLPLVRGSTEGSPRRAAARSGVALVFAGGVNAAATLAILPVPVLWLLTRSRGPRRRALMSWWALSVVLACVWWAIPLAVLGKYSPPFLDWIESSAVTTSPTSLIAALRGVDHWQAYLGPGVWPGGWLLVAAPAAIIATTVVAALGVLGLAHGTTPHRMFLITSLFLGLVLVTLGHVATVGPPFAGTVRALLDGALNAFRNVHKFDPVIRLPLAIGAGHALAAIARRLPERSTMRVRGFPTIVHPRALSLIGLIGVAAVAITPALSGKVIPQTRSVNDPSWWVATGSWLGQHEGSARALVVPGAAQPVYLWGSPRDDGLQPVADGPWTVRDAAPLTQPGYVRLLDSIESSLAAGRDDPTLSAVLARAGIRYLVVRNDLDTQASGAIPLRFVHATIANSPGFRQAARFGPDLTITDPNRLVDLGLTGARGSVDIYLNTAWDSQVSLLPAQGTVVANGSSDELPSLVAAGLGARTPVVFGPEPASLMGADVPTTTVLTDGTRRREFGFGGINTYSATMTATEPFSTSRAAHDYLPADAGQLSTVAYSGITNVRASSSASAATAVLYASAADSPWAALDGDPATSWLSASLHGAVGQWLDVDLAQSVDASAMQIAFAPGQGNYPSRIRVNTDGGVRDADVSPGSDLQSLQLPPGPTQSIRITVLAMADGTHGNRVGISTLSIPGVSPTRSVVVPEAVSPSVLAFNVTRGERSACLTVSGSAACDPSWAARGEEDDALDRTFTLGSGASYELSAAVRLRPGGQTNAILDAGNPVRAIVSSVDSSDSRERPGAAVDGNSSTGWVAAQGDRAPTITVSLNQPHRLDGLVVMPDSNAPVTSPTQVLVQVPGEQFAASVPASGRISFPRSVTARTISVTVLKSTLRTSTDSLTGTAHLLPVGIGEIRLLGAGVPVGKTQHTVDIGCNAGLQVQADGATLGLQVRASAADVLDGRAVGAQACGKQLLALGSGVHRLRLPADGLATPQSVTLVRAGKGASLAETTSDSAGSTSVQKWSATHRRVQVSTSTVALLAVRENANAGWHARLDGEKLAAVTLDGWQQGWLVPAGATGLIHLDFTPQASAAWGYVLGLLSALVLLLLAGLPGRRDVPEPLQEVTPSGRSMLGLCAAALVLLGGLPGLLLAALLVTSMRLAARVGRRAPVLIAPGALLVAGLTDALAPAGSAHPLGGSGGAQLICLLALGLVVLGQARLGAPRVREATQQRAFDEVPRQGGSGSGGERGQQEQLDEVAAERLPAHPALNREQES